MKTLLRIDYNEDGGSIDIQFAQKDTDIALLLMAFDQLQRKNPTFRAIVSACFEYICTKYPAAFEHLKDVMAEKETPKATIHVTPNPTKS